jgi:hypothetical protein
MNTCLRNSAEHAESSKNILNGFKYYALPVYLGVVPQLLV